jgi:hypothetical protein
MAYQSSSRWPWIMLISRITLFIGIQATFALGFWLAGSSDSWENSANWWPFVVTITNLICAALLVRLFRKEGKRFWDIFRIRKEHIKSDLLAIFGITIVMGPVAFLPNIWLGSALFADPQQTLDMLVRPLPVWAAITGMILFPLTQGMAEIPTYFSYVLPRFERDGMSRWLAVALPAFFLGIQHCAIPLLFDIRFFTWRLLMYIPFAFLVGIVMRWRPRLLPYLVIIHVLLDLAFAAMLLNVAY